MKLVKLRKGNEKKNLFQTKKENLFGYILGDNICKSDSVMSSCQNLVSRRQSSLYSKLMPLSQILCSLSWNKSFFISYFLHRLNAKYTSSNHSISIKLLYMFPLMSSTTPFRSYSRIIHRRHKTVHPLTILMEVF